MQTSTGHSRTQTQDLITCVERSWKVKDLQEKDIKEEGLERVSDRGQS